jgi:hypothetical protein
VTPKPHSRFRRLCLSLPGVEEKPYGVHFTYGVRGKNFANQMNNHHGDGRIAVWCKAPRGTQELLVEADPKRFFVPPYVGPSGWVGARLDVKRVDWSAIRRLIIDAYRMTANRKLIAALDAAGSRR